MGYLRRLRNVFTRRKLSDELDTELQFHRDLSLRKALSRGLTRQEAEREVARRMGNTTLAKEEMRDARMLFWLESCVQDVRHGFVLMRREPTVTALVLAVLALGIGGNAAIFTLFKAAFLDPLPYAEPHRLVTILDRFQKLKIEETNPTIPEFIDIQARNHVFEHMAFFDHRDFHLTGPDGPERVFAARTTASLFPLLGVQAKLGRTFHAGENMPGHTDVVLLSDGYWRNKMGADPTAVGKTIRLNGNPTTIVGILPVGFQFDHPSLGIAEPVEIYVPYVLDENYTSRSGGHSNVRRVRAIGRLKLGVDIRQADADLQAVAASLTREHPGLYRTPQGEDSGFGVWSLQLQEAVAGRYRSLLTLLIGAVGILLAIACGNAAQLLIARSLRRGKEVAVRTALGASRARLIRLFLLESVALASMGGLLGLLSSIWITQLLIALLPMRNSVFETARPDLYVVLFGAALSLFAAIIMGAVPALRSQESLAQRGGTNSAVASRWRNSMVALQAAFSVLMLCAAGLLGQNLWQMVSTQRGFDPENVTLIQLRIPYAREQALNPTPMRAYGEYLDKLSSIEGLESAAIVTGVPVGGSVQARFVIDGGPADQATMNRQTASWQRVSPDYFRTLRIPLLSGRNFRTDDIAGRIPVAIVNQEFVRRYIQDSNPIGLRIRAGNLLTIIGVAGNVRITGLRTNFEPQIYVSYLQGYDPNANLIVRSPLPSGEVFSRVKQAIRSVYPDQAVFNSTPMSDIVSRSMATPRFQAFLIGVFALLALLMASSGLYGVISYLVTQRTSEIAIRMALGADRIAVTRAVLGETTVWITSGFGLGVALAAATSTLVRNLSQSPEGASPLMYAAIVAFYILITLVACFIPVRRATRLDPAIALRSE